MRAPGRRARDPLPWRPRAPRRQRRFAARHEELKAASLEVVRVFRSPVSALQHFASGPGAPLFPILADPDRIACRRYGVGGGILGLLRPAAWKAGASAARAGHRPRWADVLRDGIAGNPADFLAGPNGRLERVRYGVHLGDSAPPEEVLGWLRDAGPIG